MNKFLLLWVKLRRMKTRNCRADKFLVLVCKATSEWTQSPHIFPVRLVTVNAGKDSHVLFHANFVVLVLIHNHLGLNTSKSSG